MSFDLITMGRSSIDLYSNDPGAPFEEIRSFGAFVGGCPTNVAVGAARLGLKTGILTAVGEDPVGDFVLRFLGDEGVETSFTPRKAGRRTSAVLLGIEPPDRFPLVFYRDNCADIALDMEDVEQAPMDQTRLLLISGTGLSAEPSRSATLHAARVAREAGAEVVLDLDFRADQWEAPLEFGRVTREALALVDLVIGTEEEVKAAELSDASAVTIRDSQISDPTVEGDLDEAIASLLKRGPKVLALKRGARGATIYSTEGEVIPSPPFPVEVMNILGAGDAFAAGFLYGHLQGWDWKRCAQMGNATGAIVVTRQGCANFMPTLHEANALLKANGVETP